MSTDSRQRHEDLGESLCEVWGFVPGHPLLLHLCASPISGKSLERPVHGIGRGRQYRVRGGRHAGGSRKLLCETLVGRRYLAVVSFVCAGAHVQANAGNRAACFIAARYWPLKRFAGESSTRRLILEKIRCLRFNALGPEQRFGRMKKVSFTSSRSFHVARWPMAGRLPDLSQQMICLRDWQFLPSPGRHAASWEIGLATVSCPGDCGAIALRRKRRLLHYGLVWESAKAPAV